MGGCLPKRKLLVPPPPPDRSKVQDQIIQLEARGQELQDVLVQAQKKASQPRTKSTTARMTKEMLDEEVAMIESRILSVETLRVHLMSAIAVDEQEKLIQPSMDMIDGLVTDLGTADDIRKKMDAHRTTVQKLAEHTKALRQSVHPSGTLVGLSGRDVDEEMLRMSLPPTALHNDYDDEEEDEEDDSAINLHDSRQKHASYA